ncbi:DUF4157 domain-containing protein [Streptomyces sp. NPDC057496]|uniref:eCIS core domain-containing protein n=1 Tax=Streptomyces sp. NPDC057496 TaxID=3346149 RepID=UPI003698D7A2
MRSQDSAEKTGVEHRPAPARTPAAAGGEPPLAGLHALQSTIGNAAVVQMLRATGHQQAEQAPVQRSAVPDVLRATGQPMDNATRTDMEARLGTDFSDVRIHNDSAAKASAAELGARAYTSGNHIVIGDGGGDKHTLAHELTHVIQQRQGPVAGTDNGAGLSVSDPSDRFEREAEANAHRVMREPGTVQRRPLDAEPGVGAASGPVAVPVVQRWSQTDKQGATMHGDNPQFTSDGNRAGTVTVTGLHGTPLEDGCNQPKAAGDPVGWAALASQGLQLGGKMPAGAHYNAVRMHLWNGRLGGPGDNRLNLAPGPAQVNSTMSTRAETPVKDLVEYGYTVDLTTQVSYQRGPGNPLDLATVVPNRIAMRWTGRRAGQTDQKGSWTAQIPLPVAALTPQEQQAYQQMQDTPQQAQVLLADLANRTDQYRVEVLAVVGLGLKQLVMTAYPGLYTIQTPQDKAAFLTMLPHDKSMAFLNGVLGADAHLWLKHCLEPLIGAGQQQAAQKVFLGKPALQQDMIKACPSANQHQLLAGLGAPAAQLVPQWPLLFSYYPADRQAALCTEMHQAGLLDGFLAQLSGSAPLKQLPGRYQVLDAWATVEHQGDPVDFLNSLPNLKADYKTEFSKEYARHVQAAQYQADRPRR